MKTQAEWSLMTKFPGDAKEYRILAGSAGGLDVQGIRKWLTGEVPFDANSYNPGAPWYQFGVEGGPLQQVLIRQEWTEYADFSNRPVLITTCLLMPFVDLAKAGCGFGQLVELFDQEDVKAFLAERLEGIKKGQEKTDFDRLDVNLPEQEETLIRNKQIVDEIGYDSCVMVSDALLRGSLCLVQAGGMILPWQDRLKWLDAALMLLPYGLRADCPTTLWASSSAPHAMRVYWGREARQGHARLMIPVGATLASKENQEDYIRNLSMLKDRMGLEKILGYVIKKDDPYSFGVPLPRNILLELGRNLIVLDRIRRESPNLTAQTIEEGGNVLETGGLGTLLTEAEQDEFILKFMPHIKVGQIKNVMPYLNDHLTESFMEESVKSFEQLIPGNMDFLRISALLLLHSGKGVELFSRLHAFLLKNDQTRHSRYIGLFVQMLHYTLRDGGQNMSQGTGTDEGPIAQLRQWVVKECPEDCLFSWADWIVSSQQSVVSEPLTEVLMLYTGSTLATALKSSWGVSTESWTAILDTVNDQDVDNLSVLIKVAAFRQTLPVLFVPVAHALLKWQRAGNRQIRATMNSMLVSKDLSPASLSIKECAVLDEMRLLADVDVLTLPKMFGRNTSEFFEYQTELLQSIGSLPNLLRIHLFEQLYHLLMELSPLIPDEDVSDLNLAAFCAEMFRLSQDKKWKTYNYTRYKQSIYEAVKHKAAPNELARFCEPVLLVQLNKQNSEGPENWIWLINLLDEYKYPNKALDLWRLVCWLGNYVVQNGGDSVRQKGGEGSDLEVRFHRAVINDGKILTLPDQRDIYLTLVSKKIALHIILLGEIAPAVKKLPQWRTWLEHFDQVISWLTKQLSGGFFGR